MGDGEEHEPMNNEQTVLVILLVSILLATPTMVGGSLSRKLVSLQ